MQLSHMPLFVMANDIVSPGQLPSLNAICLLDCILSKVETSLKDHFIGSIVSHNESLSDQFKYCNSWNEKYTNYHY